jgi:hypothetical protein
MVIKLSVLTLIMSNLYGIRDALNRRPAIFYLASVKIGQKTIEVV